MFDAFMLFAGALLVAGATVLFSRAVRQALTKPWAAITIAAGAAAISAGTWLITETGHSGTGDVTRHGWPKPYYFERVDWEGGSRSGGVEPLYFLGNSLVYAAALLLLWTFAALFLSRRRG